MVLLHEHLYRSSPCMEINFKDLFLCESYIKRDSILFLLLYLLLILNIIPINNIIISVFSKFHLTIHYFLKGVPESCVPVVKALPDKMNPESNNVDYDEITNQQCCEESRESHIGNGKKPDNNGILENGNTQNFTESSHTYFTLLPPQVAIVARLLP